MFLIIQFFVKNYKFPLFFCCFFFVNLNLFQKFFIFTLQLDVLFDFYLKKLYFAVMLILWVLISDIWLIHAGVKGIPVLIYLPDTLKTAVQKSFYK